jgi:nitroreductase
MTLDATRAPAADRYGDDAFRLGATGDVVDLLLAHRSVRRFAPGDVTDEQLRTLVAAAQSAPTSSNLQPWSVVAVRDRARKERLAHLAADQRFVADCSVLLVWVADLGRAHRLAARRGTEVAATTYLESTLIAFIDTALAAQNAVVAAEALGLGSTFVGAIRNRPDEVALELGLPDGTVAAFGLAVGVPDPTEAAGVKPRLPQSAVLHLEQYDAGRGDAAIEAYDEVLGAYNSRFGLTGGWTDRVLARLRGPESMAGRHVLREVLERRGMPSR